MNLILGLAIGLLTLAVATFFALRSVRGSATNPTLVAGRRYVLHFAIAMLAFIGLAVASGYFVEQVPPAWRYVVALLPAVPLAYVGFAGFRLVRETDEFSRKVTLESLGVAFVLTAIFSVVCGLLEDAGMPRLSAWWTWAILMGTWAAASLWHRAYYR